ncbi:hypothetical protein DB346_23585 [Verrucomicrobia bacterium LW23]|nr:hypothetical protein DB346_23585 [Verrucomicrobia bacterium LW23]
MRKNCVRSCIAPLTSAEQVKEDYGDKYVRRRGYLKSKAAVEDALAKGKALFVKFCCWQCGCQIFEESPVATWLNCRDRREELMRRRVKASEHRRCRRKVRSLITEGDDDKLSAHSDRSLRRRWLWKRFSSRYRGSRR